MCECVCVGGVEGRGEDLKSREEMGSPQLVGQQKREKVCFVVIRDGASGRLDITVVHVVCV